MGPLFFLPRASGSSGAGITAGIGGPEHRLQVCVEEGACPGGSRCAVPVWFYA